MSHPFPLLAAATVLLAGCLGGGGGTEPPAADELPPLRADAPFAHLDGVRVPLPATFADLRVRLVETGFSRGEPTMGVAADGTMFVTAPQGELARSRDHGRSWERVSTPTSHPLTPKTSLDAWAWLDPLTDRVYNAPLWVGCTWAAWSDDAGETWDANPAAGCGLPGHDHQKLTTGPPPAGVPTSGYPNLVYYQYNSFRRDGTLVTTSADGGRTWGAAVIVFPADDCHGGIAGPVAVAPDGTAHVARASCNGVAVATSRDGGATWTPTRLEARGATREPLVDPDIAVDGDGNAYLAWPGRDNLPYLAVSRDRGETWSHPVAVSPPGVNATVFNVVTAGAPGRVAVGYLGTTADDYAWPERRPSNAAPETTWHAYLTFTEDAFAATPTFVTVRLTPDDDPVQRGCIWLEGLNNACRNLLDFTDMVQRDGRTYMVYADGCDRCASNTESRGSAVTVAVVERGPGLLGLPLAPLP